jgi:hypothetical protein
MSVKFLILAGVISTLGGLFVWRQADQFAAQRAWKALTLVSAPQKQFSSSMVGDLPEPAQRYFRYAIIENTPLRTVVELEMTGQLGFGAKNDPKYRPMTARQVLAPPFGFVWTVQTGAIAGSDGASPNQSWTRFWLFKFIPIVRASGRDHWRSAFGRLVAESAFWAPASLLPSQYVRWEPLGDDSARAVVAFNGQRQSVDIFVDPRGALTHVVILRWSNENPERIFRVQPFGGELSDYREVEGYRLPFRVNGGNHFGTNDYFPFYKIEVTRISFPKPEVAIRGSLNATGFRKIGQPPPD